MILLNLVIKPVYADEEKNIPQADILLLYSKNITEEQVKDVASIADILTYMGYKVSYSNIENSIGKLGEFSNVIIYSTNEKENNDFINELCSSNNKVMIIGGKIIQQIRDKLKLSVTCKNIIDYRYNVAYDFSKNNSVEVSNNDKDSIILEGDVSYKSGRVTGKNIDGFFCTRVDKFTHMVTYNAKSDILKAILTQEIALWMWPYKGLPHSYAQYVVFDEVYPFTNPDKLMKIADFMRKNNIPYAISAMPIYENTNFLSMKRFCEVLTYMQANGGAVILHYPIIQSDEMTASDIQKKINTALSAYTAYGVYPIALEAPNNWMYSDVGKEIMRRFRTIVLKNSEENGWTTNEMNNGIYSDGHNIISQALTNGDDSASIIKYHSSAVYLDVNEDMEELTKKIQAIKNSEISVNSMWALGQAVYTDKIAIVYENSILKLQGNVVQLEYIPFEYDDKLNYKKNGFDNLKEVMAQNNRILLAGIFISIIIFISFILIARYKNHKKFFYSDDQGEK
jgi:uncharacterized protein YdaL